MHKLVRSSIHQVDQLICFFDDRCAVAPCEQGRKKPGDLDIGALREPVGHRDRIHGNERRNIVFRDFPI
jgi:hypothetical protein